MKKRYLLLLPVFLVAWVIYIRSSTPKTEPNAPESAAVSGVMNEQAKNQAREQAAYDAQARAYAEELGRREANQRLRAKAAAGMKTERARLSSNHQAEWAALISTNTGAFMSLRQQAAHADHKQIACTICDGTGVMKACIVCDHSDGKCVTCGGTGRIANGEYCPACVGTGKCYFCGGSGKMQCPFCDDGVITDKGQGPSLLMSVH